jgi:hypothetical protein
VFLECPPSPGDVRTDVLKGEDDLRVASKDEPRPGHPDDLHRRGVHRHGASHDVDIAAEAVVPRCVGEQRHPRRPVPVVLGEEVSSHEGRRAQDIEHLGSGDQCVDALRPFLSSQVYAAEPIGCHGLQQLRSGLQVQEVWEGLIDA